MNAKSFLQYQYGITLLKEKALIHPEMLLKAMEEYAEYRVKNCNTTAVTKCALPERKPSVCRHCKSDDIYFDMDAGTWVCNECNEKAN